MTTAWVPCDAAAVALGADAVADAIAAAGVTVRRNGSRGMLWLEPLVEIETERGRVGYGNITEAEVGPLLDGALDDTERCIGVVDEHDWLARQHRVSFARVGVIEPTDLAAYREPRWAAGPGTGAGALRRGGRRRGDGVRAARPRRCRASRPASSGRRCAPPPPT